MKILLTYFLVLLALPVLAQEAQPAHSTALTLKTTKAYEAKAEAKVKELYSYLELLTDPKLNPDMKTQVRKETEKLFGDNETLLNLFSKKLAYLPLKEMLDTAVTQKEKRTFTVSGITVIKSRVWMLNYTVNCGAYSIKVQQPFLMTEEEKQFGTTTRTVVNTYLGPMRDLQ